MHHRAHQHAVYSILEARIRMAQSLIKMKILNFWVQKWMLRM